MMGSMSMFKNTDNRSTNYEKDDEKENQIF